MLLGTCFSCGRKRDEVLRDVLGKQARGHARWYRANLPVFGQIAANVMHTSHPSQRVAGVHPQPFLLLIWGKTLCGPSGFP